MRVLHVVHGYPPLDVGGVEWHVQTLSHQLSAAGHAVGVFAGAYNLEVDETPLQLSEGLVRRVRRTASPDPRLVTRDGHVEAEFDRVLMQFLPDVVHVHHLLFLSLALPEMAAARGFPVVATVHDLWLLSHDFRPHLPLRRSAATRAVAAAARGWRRPRSAVRSVPLVVGRYRMAERALRAPERILAPSQFVRKVVLRAGVPSDRMRLVPHGTEPVEPAHRRQSQGGHAPMRLLVVGSLVPNKGLHVLLVALQQLSPGSRAMFAVSVWGQEADPAYSDAVRKLARGLNVTFHGGFVRDDLDVVYADADLLVLPALWAETFSLVVHEAAARGIPTLASNVGALPAAVAACGGAIFNPRRPASLADLLEQVVRDPTLVDRWAAGAKPLPTPEDNVGKVLEVYREVVRPCEPPTSAS